MPRCRSFALAALLAVSSMVAAADHHLHRFRRIELSDVYFSEGANFGDFNGDGQLDTVCGPYWYAGPDFKTRREIYPPKPQPRERYADNFFSWAYDFSGDGLADLFTVGFPGTPAFVYVNPGKEATGHWRKRQVFDAVSNESPQFTQLVGDERPELVCTHNGFFGYAEIAPAGSTDKWVFRPVSERIAPGHFGHGLGVGDVDGDGRLDILLKDGWLQQPEKLGPNSLWRLHQVAFCPIGGADLYAYDVDGDGDHDVITSLAAHEFGLAWHEQVRQGEKISFRRHLIMGNRPEQNRYGVVFTELHAVALTDVDGDGLKDIVTGKTYWSHHKSSPMWDAGAVVYWFRLVRGPDGVDWVPNRADDRSGIGRQLSVGDLGNDNMPDFVVGGMKGAFVLHHEKVAVDLATFQKAQPKPIAGYLGERGVFTIPHALEAEALAKVTASDGRAQTQNMDAFTGDRWSGGAQLLWIGGRPGARLTLPLPVAKSGNYELGIALTRARDFGIIRLALDDKPLGDPIDLYHQQVTATGVLPLGTHELKAEIHRVTVELVGRNPASVPSHLVGIDCLVLKPAR